MAGDLKLQNAAVNTVSNSNNWFTDGTNNFGTGAANVLTNTGLIQAGSPARNTPVTFDGLSAVNNSGEFLATSTPGTAAVSFSGPGLSFNNLATGIVTMQNTIPTVGDKITINGNYTGTAGSILGVDAHLGGPGSKADVLAVTGNTAGTTKINVRDDDPSSPGHFNPTGITVVTVGGTSNASNFTLANGPIDKGLWEYTLAKLGNNFALITVPSGEVMALPTLVSQSTRFWQTGESSVEDHRASMRAAFSGAPALTGEPGYGGPALGYSGVDGFDNPFDHMFDNNGKTDADRAKSAPGQSAVWAQAVHASFTESTNSTAAIGPGFSFDNSTSQSLTRFLGGVDFGSQMSKSAAMSFGLYGGYGTSTGTMTTTGSGGIMGGLSSFNFTGTSFGGYAQYLVGPWWVGVSTLYDKLDGTYDISRLGFSQSTKGSVWGSQVDAGWKVDLNQYGSVEPYVALTYIVTTLNDIVTPNGQVSFGDQSGVDGKIVARGRMPVYSYQDWDFTLLANLAIVHDFNAATPVTFDGFVVPNTTSANWGDIGAGVEVGQKGGAFTGYLKGDWITASGLTGTSFQGGLHYRF
jgi:hypothetical protein